MDIVAGIIELISVWMIGNKVRIAFLLLNVANGFWIWAAVTHHMYGLLLICIPGIFINIRNYIKWGKDEKSTFSYREAQKARHAIRKSWCGIFLVEEEGQARPSGIPTCIPEV